MPFYKPKNLQEAVPFELEYDADDEDGFVNILPRPKIEEEIGEAMGEVLTESTVSTMTAEDFLTELETIKNSFQPHKAEIVSLQPKSTEETAKAVTNAEAGESSPSWDSSFPELSYKSDDSIWNSIHSLPEDMLKHREDCEHTSCSHSSWMACSECCTCGLTPHRPAGGFFERPLPIRQVSFASQTGGSEYVFLPGSKTGEELTEVQDTGCIKGNGLDESQDVYAETGAEEPRLTRREKGEREGRGPEIAAAVTMGLVGILWVLERRAEGWFDNMQI